MNEIYLTEGTSILLLDGKSFSCYFFRKLCHSFSTFWLLPLEEADTRIVVYILHAVQVETTRKVLVRIADKDVIVLLMGKYHFLKEIQPDLDIWGAFGMGRNFRFISVNAICSHLGEARSRSLSVLHELNGCDPTSSFYRQCKVSAWQAWELYSDVTQTFQFVATLTTSNAFKDSMSFFMTT